MAGRSYCRDGARTFGLGWSLANPHAARAAGEANHAELQSRANSNYARGPRRSDDENPLGAGNAGNKAAVAECILKAAANGQTSYDGLIAAASEQIQTILSMLT
jgi:hypothetical protein